MYRLGFVESCSLGWLNSHCGFLPWGLWRVIIPNTMGCIALIRDWNDDYSACFRCLWVISQSAGSHDLWMLLFLQRKKNGKWNESIGAQGAFHESTALGNWDHRVSCTTLPSGVHPERQIMSTIYTVHLVTLSFMWLTYNVIDHPFVLATWWHN